MFRYAKLALVAGLTLFLLNCPSAPKPPEKKTVETPVFSPAGGTYTETVTVEIKSATDGAEIRYTLDGSAPSATNGTLYSGPVKIEKTTEVAAIATLKDWLDSEIAKATYTISIPVPVPVKQSVGVVAFDPPAGTYTGEVSVKLSSSTEGAQIYYTTDGSKPTAQGGTLYSTPLEVKDSVTIQAFAVKQDMIDAAVTSAAYTIKPAVTVTDGEIAEVRDAIARAKEADADYYDPEDLSQAESLLDDALAARASDPEKAKDDLASAKAKADLAFQTSVEKAAEDLSRRMDALNQMLLKKQADKFLPDEYAQATAGIDESKTLYENGDLSGARARAYETLKEMADLSSRLDDRIAWVKILKRDTEQYLQDAEAADANTWAPEAKNKANGLYLQGMEAFQAYKLNEAEESYGSAREAAKDAVRIARDNRSATTADLKKKTEALKLETMKALQDASSLTVVTEDGTVIPPSNWTGEDVLNEIEKLEQERQKQEQENQSSGGHSMAVPRDGATVVLADESTEDLLTQAKEMWRLGLEEEAKGNYVKAQEYYQEALRYVEVYKSFAVKGVYTVRLILERRDCLWRISEYDFIYGNPRLWPKIWRRNRKLIQNPDLIYPGWLLVIPPE